MKFRSALLASAMMALPVAAAHAQAIDGPYVGSGAGINFMQRESVELSGATGTAKGNVRVGVGPVVVINAGWGFGNGLRAEIEGNYRGNNGFSNPQGFGAPGSIGGNELKYGAFANVLYDFVGMVPMVQPYVGLGLGYERELLSNLHGSTVAGGPLFTSAKTHGRGSLAYQAILGTAFPIDAVPGLAITAEYRFMGLTSNRKYGINGVPAGGATFRSTDNYNHSVLFGVRYAFGMAPAAAAPMPVTDQGAKTFLVFFDWNRADLTARSQGIVRDAATYSTSTPYTRIDVDGNADTSGTAGYNQGLSERRARVVASELVRDGVPQNVISMHAYGDTKLLVPTGPATREPQNRRVEIVFH